MAEKRDLESAQDKTTDEAFVTSTDEELLTLRKVSGSIPPIAYLICVVELAERASYYGVKGVFNNFMQFPLPAGGDGTGAVPRDNPNGHAGALYVLSRLISKNTHGKGKLTSSRE